jgi:hypothetical protein
VQILQCEKGTSQTRINLEAVVLVRALPVPVSSLPFHQRVCVAAVTIVQVAGTETVTPPRDRDENRFRGTPRTSMKSLRQSPS